jgi:hypothetical protein
LSHDQQQAIRSAVMMTRCRKPRPELPRSFLFTTIRCTDETHPRTGRKKAISKEMIAGSGLSRATGCERVTVSDPDDKVKVQSRLDH